MSGVVTKASKVLGDKGGDGEMGLVDQKVDRQGGFRGPRGTSTGTRRLRVRGALIG